MEKENFSENFEIQKMEFLKLEDEKVVEDYDQYSGDAFSKVGSRTPGVVGLEQGEIGIVEDGRPIRKFSLEERQRYHDARGRRDEVVKCLSIGCGFEESEVKSLMKFVKLDETIERNQAFQELLKSKYGIVGEESERIYGEFVEEITDVYGKSLKN